MCLELQKGDMGQAIDHEEWWRLEKRKP